MEIIKKFLPETFYNFSVDIYLLYFTKYRNKSYSQEGEDLILKRIYEHKKDGFYVDVGSLHPFRFSNTYLFYKIGWRGINIEPRPGSKILFDKYRKRDINIEAAISDSNENLTYYMFNEPALNSFDKQLSLQRLKTNKYKIIKEIEIKTKRLSDILDEVLPQNTKIDFLTIDVEGFDLSVLKSNNWGRYRPEIILCEDSNFTLESPNNSEVYLYLYKNHYRLIAKTVSTLIFKSII